MTSLTDIKDTLKSNKQRLTDKYGLSFLAIFGSYGRGQQTENSDIDILVEIGDNISLLDFVGIKLEIEDALGSKVDLVEYNTIKPLLRDRILKEQVVIL